MAQSFFVNSSAVGVDLNNASSTALFAVGTHFLGNNDTEWVYVQANTSILGNTMVAFNATYTCGMASGGDLTLGSQLASAQTSISSQAYGWVAIRGIGLTVSQTGTTQALGPVSLAASGVPTGFISFQITASNTLAGVMFTATVSVTACTVNMTWPRGAANGL